MNLDISMAQTVWWDEYWGESNREPWDDFWDENYHARYNQTYTMSVPADYDGIVLMIRKDAGDCDVADDYYTDAARSERRARDEEWGKEDHYILDPDRDGDVPVPAEDGLVIIVEKSNLYEGGRKHGKNVPERVQRL